MHSWGDDFKYFAEVDAAAYEIGEFCKRYGRIFVSQTKEKFGTARVYCHFGGLSLHSFLFPGWHYKRKGFPQWLWKLDIYYLSKLFSLFYKYGFGKWQVAVYKEAYRRALKKYPMIREEILYGADYDELLEHVWTKEDYKKQRDEYYESFQKYRAKCGRLHERWEKLATAYRKVKTSNEN